MSGFLNFAVDVGGAPSLSGEDEICFGQNRSGFLNFAAAVGGAPPSGEDLVHAALNRGSGQGCVYPKKEGRCSKCGIGNDVSLEDAKQEMDPIGQYEWGEDGVSLFCHPKEILPGSVERDKFRVAFKKCQCQPSPLWTRKFGENLKKTGRWTNFNEASRCKYEFQGRVRNTE